MAFFSSYGSDGMAFLVFLVPMEVTVMIERISRPRKALMIYRIHVISA